MRAWGCLQNSVCRRPIRPVPFPGHFLVRVELEAPLYLDPASGRSAPRQLLGQIAAEELRLGHEEALAKLSPAGPRELLLLAGS